MKRILSIMPAVMAGCLLIPQLRSQEPNPTQRDIPAQATGETPVYQITVVSRTTQAVNYQHRSGETKVDLRGTALMPQAKGHAEVEAKRGVTEVEVSVDEMGRPSSYGPEYLTYVLWAITPEGRATNLGELDLDGDDDAKLDTTTELQVFGLVVTAEPYFAVTQPSDVVVMENMIRDDTRGTFQPIVAKYELLRRGHYVQPSAVEERTRLDGDSTVPLALREARNAVRIAQWAGAEKHAADTLNKARTSLQNAEGYYKADSGDRALVPAAREAVQMAEDARLITIRKVQEQRLAAERAQSKQATSAAIAVAEAEAMRRERAEAENQMAQRRAAELRAEAERSRIQAREAARMKAEAEAASAEAKADAERAREARERAEALREEAEKERAEVRKQLQQQLNTVLETRETARGLIVNVSDVLFDTGKYTLRPVAREKLAKVAGILLTHPDLKIEVEGHTDSVGDTSYNQRLSEQRASSVLDYLTGQGISRSAITAKGFGEAQPVASNDTAEGRQQNRRVELVVSGENIGTVSRR